MACKPSCPNTSWYAPQLSQSGFFCSLLQGSKAGRDELRLLLTQTLGALPLTLDTQETVLSQFLEACTDDHAPLQMQLMQLLLQHAPDKVPIGVYPIPTL